MFQIHRDIAALTRSVIWVIGMIAVYKWEDKSAPKTVFFDVCSEEKNFVSKLKSEADKREVCGYAVPYDGCCAKGEFQAVKDAFDEVKGWISANSSPASETGKHFRLEGTCNYLIYKNFEIKDPKDCVTRK